MFVLQLEFDADKVGDVFTAVANCFGSIAAETGSYPYQGIETLEDLLPAVTKVAAEWKELSPSYAHVFERRWTPFHFDFLVTLPSQDVIILVRRGTMRINFGRDSQSLSNEMVNKLSATSVDELKMYDENWKTVERKVSSPSY